ncbi:hypothetical protein GCM10027299_16820 [Larkinella ripae]
MQPGLQSLEWFDVLTGIGIFEKLRMAMQQTFEINAGKITAQFIEHMLTAAKTKFGNRNVKIIIEDSEPFQAVSQKEIFKRMEEHRKKLSTVQVDPNLDLSALANEVNDTPL